MKKIILCCLMAVVCCGAGMAQQMEEKKQKKSVELTTVVFSSDIDCEHCAAKVETNAVVLGKGIREVEADASTKQITVTFDASKNSVENIVKGLATLRVKAQPIEQPAEGK